MTVPALSAGTVHALVWLVGHACMRLHAFRRFGERSEHEKQRFFVSAPMLPETMVHFITGGPCMAFDGITTFAICSELRQRLLGGRIDKIYQPEADEAVLSIRSLGQNYRLLLTCQAAHPAIAHNRKKAGDSAIPAYVLYAISQALCRRKDYGYRPD